MKGMGATLILLLFMFAATAWSQSPVPLGGIFQVNTYTTSVQSDASVGFDADGNFVVVWHSFGSTGTDTSGFSIQGQRYDAAGTVVGDEFQINTLTTAGQRFASVAVDSDGDFVVVWSGFSSSGTDTSLYGINGQRYDSSGAPVSGQFQINTYTPGNQINPSVAAGAGGGFVVVWTSYGSSGTDTAVPSIQGQRYDALGAPEGGEFQINTYTTGKQRLPSVEADADGNFVVVWDSYGSSGTDTSGYSIQSQRYDAAGISVGGEFQVNTYTTYGNYLPDVALDSDGNFVVVWTSYGSSGTDTSAPSIQGQRYDAIGAPVGGEFQINTYTTGRQLDPSVAADSQGSFLVVWTSYGSEGTDTSISSIQGQRYDTMGAPVGGEFQINTYTTGRQRYPSVEADADGNFVVVWDSYGSSGTDTSGESVQGQRFTTSFFADGFESADTTAWSSSVP